MKYNDKNKPLVCMMTQSTCYKGTRKFAPTGVLWHSTGANNPYLKRYVEQVLDRQAGRRDYDGDSDHALGLSSVGLRIWQ